MGTQAGVGISHHRNPRIAGQQAATQALAEAAVERPDFVLLFATVGYDQRAVLDAVRERTAGAPLIGCSAEGIIVRNEADESNFSVAVMAIRSDEVRFRNVLATGLKADPAGAGRAIAETIRPDVGSDALGLFVFADPLSFNFDRFVAGLEATLALERPLPLLGGEAGDNWSMARTYQYCDDRVVSDGVAAALWSGTAHLAWAVNHGCTPIGTQRTVTRSQANDIFEIDHRPVLDVFGEYLTKEERQSWMRAVGNLAMGMKAAPEMGSYDAYVVRAILRRDDGAASVGLSTEMPEGTSVWVMRRDQDKIARGLQRIADELKTAVGDRPPKLVLQFECAGRGKVIFRDEPKVQLHRRLQHELAPGTPWLGFYTYGEISPVGERNCYHNYTSVVATLS